ncbi:hypothetical protein HHI36_003498 [Cryptolaemus montrouzieri]|uniref:Secreted protein n=1 Tax=Cryptolaemus montrouzieri TaxID=559131 RepID=A0ABD2PF32_9CUCU
MSFAAWIPSSFRFFSICLLLARAALSSAEEVQPILQLSPEQNTSNHPLVLVGRSTATYLVTHYTNSIFQNII